jgi:hypothetical protein
LIFAIGLCALSLTLTQCLVDGVDYLIDYILKI